MIPESFEQRILALDAKCRHPSGFSLSRIFKETGLGLEWSIGIGQIGQPKLFISGDTLEEVISKTEKIINEV